MRLSWLIIFVAAIGCDLFSELDNSAPHPFPDQIPVFEFSYSNSLTLPGWIRYRNHCTSIVSYKWYLGFTDANGNEAISYSYAPKVKYPQNGTYRVIVQGLDINDKMHEKILSIQVSNY
ncbi:MAG TPA: PKD domain-containing protein [Cyclobacteriaceae bacterium]